MGTGGAGDRSTNLLIGKQPLPIYCNDRTYCKLLVTLKSRKIILDFLKEPCTVLEKKKIWTDENQAGGGSGTAHDPKHTRHYLLNIVEAMLWFVHVYLPIETS